MNWLRRGAKRDVWEDIVGEAEDRLSITNPRQRAFCIALILGGSAGAKGAVEVLLDGGYRPDKDKRALSSASEVFSLALLAMWLDKFDQATPRPDDERDRARREWATIVMDAFADESRRLYEWFLNWDVQFRSERLGHDSPERTKNLFPCYSLLADISIEVPGGRVAQIPSVGFPFTSLQDYQERGGGQLTCSDPIAIVSTGDCLVDAYELSLRFHEHLTGTS